MWKPFFILGAVTLGAAAGIVATYLSPNYQNDIPTGAFLGGLAGVVVGIVAVSYAEPRSK